ncbi:dihydroxyacetone kinase subunit L [Spirochaetia bacterium]|nr:dihydroxyacetone kinase subunit L [Spirochaetia bacterium]
MPDFLTEDNVRDMIVYTADKIIENKSLLTEVDRKIGDGDHGIGMAGGMKKAKDAVLGTGNSGNVYALFEKAGKAMLMSMGGASGVIFGSFYMAGAKGSEPAAELSPDGFARMMEKSLNAIKERGKAQIGDKTMIDALEPAVEAMKKKIAEGFVSLLRAAVEASAEGVENTKKYEAKFGRAKSLMERAVGFQDAGATSVWIIFRSMGEFVEKLS